KTSWSASRTPIQAATRFAAAHIFRLANPPGAPSRTRVAPSGYPPTSLSDRPPIRSRQASMQRDLRVPLLRLSAEHAEEEHATDIVIGKVPTRHPALL